MGHNAGWLTLGAGLGGGADVIIIPEIPYSIDVVAESIKNRRSAGSPFSVVAVAEGAIEDRLAVELGALQLEFQATDRIGKSLLKTRSRELFDARLSTVEIANQLSERTSLESRVTILGHVQRGGTPSPDDRILAANLGTAATDVIARGEFGVMVAARGDGYTTIPLKTVAGKRHAVPLDHPWIRSARSLGVCMGDAI
jgi:6-phosphofructokinase 1